MSSQLLSSLTPRLTNLRATRVRVVAVTFKRGAEKIWGFIVVFVGLVIASNFGAIFALAVKGISAYLVCTLFFTAVSFCYTYNWNISDEALLKQLEQRKLAWYSQFGSTVGTILGWGVCGFLPGIVVYGFNKPLGRHIIKEVGEEGWDEILDSLVDLAGITARNEINKWVTYLYISFRALVRNAANDRMEDVPLLGGIINRILNFFPKWKEALKNWGNGNEPWILSEKVEELIDESPLPHHWKEFLEEVLDEFGDACMEAGFVVARAIDSWHAARAEEQRVLDTPERVVITPNSAIPEETIVLEGSPRQLAPTISSLMATHSFIENREVGRTLEPESTIQYAEQMSYPVSVILYWRNKEKPPYGRSVMNAENKTLRTQQLTIPGVNKANLYRYKEIKEVMGYRGKTSHFRTGPFLATASIPGFRPFALYGDTLENAHRRLYEILEYFLDPNIINLKRDKVTMNVTYLVPEYSRDEVKALRREPELMYPWCIDVISKFRIKHDADLSNILKPNSRIKATKQGVFLNVKTRLPLYLDDKPEDWNETLGELFKFDISP